MLSRLILAVLVFGLVSCTAPSNSEAPVKRAPYQAKVIAERAFGDCPVSARQPEVVNYSKQQWRDERTRPVLSPTKVIPWDVNFSNESVVRYSMGSKPSLGFSVERVGPIIVNDGIVVLTVLEKSPKPDAIVATALTLPCVYVHIEGANARGVQVVDGDGQLLIESP